MKQIKDPVFILYETGSFIVVVSFVSICSCYEFMVIRNSSLFLVRTILLWIVFIASTGFMSAMYLRRIHMRSRVVLS